MIGIDHVFYHRDCFLAVLGLESRDRFRLRKAKGVLHDPQAMQGAGQRVQLPL